MGYSMLYIIACFIIGLLGVNRKFGFWGYFFGSIILTPIIGLILILASDPIYNMDKYKAIK